MRTTKSIICLIITLIMLSISIFGCNTMKGAGKDIERGGEKIQDAAD